MGNDAKPTIGDGERKELLAEYSSLREEIQNRIEFRHKLNTILLSATAAILGATAVTEQAALAYILPVLVAFLALAWVQNDFRIGQLGKHIRERIEARLDGLSWETEVQRMRTERKGLRHWRRTVVAQTGVLLVAQAASVVLGSLVRDATSSKLDGALAGLGLAAMAIVVLTMLGCMRRSERLG